MVRRIDGPRSTSELRPVTALRVRGPRATGGGIKSNAMHTLLRGLIVVGMLSGVAHAQSVAGTWQGTLNVGKELRIVMTIGNDRYDIERPSDN